MSRGGMTYRVMESPQDPQGGPHPSQKRFSPYIVCCSSQHLLDLELPASVLCHLDPSPGWMRSPGALRSSLLQFSVMVARAHC